MNFQESQYIEEKQSIYYDLVQKIIKFKSKNKSLDSQTKLKGFFKRLDDKYGIFNCQLLRDKILELLVQNTSESINAKSVNFLKSYISSIYSNSDIQTFNIMYYLESKDFKKVVSLFKPCCLIDEIMFDGIFAKSNLKMMNKYNKAIKIMKKIKKERDKLFLYEKFLIHIPDYLNLTNKTFKSLMLKKGYINIDWRFYLAIMAVSVNKCKYLITCLEELFIFYGGDKNWLIYGMKVVPEKLQKIAKLNDLMAHQPIELQINHLQELINTNNLYHSWNINEIVHASAILFHFQKLSSFSNCLNIELPVCLCSEPDPFSYSPKEKDNYVFKIHSLSCISCNSSEKDKIETKISYYEFNWLDNAFSILVDIYPEVLRIDNEFSFIIDKKLNRYLVYMKRNCEILDKECRRCIVCYAELLLGYRNDDYDYSKINKNLSSFLKEFIKKILFKPASVSSKDIEEMKFTFNISEIVELIILTLNIKNRLQLTIVSSLIMNVRRNIDT